MQKFNCHLQKSKKALFSRLFKITALKTGEEPQRTENPSFYQQERLSQQLENRQRSVINHFIQLQTFIHSHPSICPTNTACWPGWLQNLKKNWTPGQIFFPRGTEPSEHIHGSWPHLDPENQAARKWMSLKGLTLYEGPKSMEKRPLQFLSKVEKQSNWWPSSDTVSWQGLSNPSPFRPHTMPRRENLSCFFWHNVTASNPLSMALHHPYRGFINKTQEIGKCSKYLRKESEDHKF